MIDINRINNCRNLPEFVVSLYVYCLKTFGEIRGSIDTSPHLLIQEAKNYIPGDVDRFNLFDKLKNKELKNSLDCLVCLLAIDNNFISLSIAYFLDYDNPIISPIDNQYYFFISTPNKILFELIDGDYQMKTEEAFRTSLVHFIKNFMVCSNNINGTMCSVSKLGDISPNSQTLLQEAYLNEEMSIGIFSPEQIIFNKKFKSLPADGNKKVNLIQCEAILNEDKIIEQIITFLEFSLKNKIKIILFPELTIYQKTREKISEWLQIYNDNQEIIMVFAGSMHICKANGSKTEYLNECIAFNDSGKEILQQNKINVLKFENNSVQYIEWIDNSNTEFTCLETFIGRMAIAICLDFISADYFELNNHFYVNFHLVPSKSDSISPFKHKAEEYGRNFFSPIVYVNYNNKSTDKGFFYIPIRSDERGFKITNGNSLIIDLFNLNNEFNLQLKK
jgi:hypothetical protein